MASVTVDCWRSFALSLHNGWLEPLPKLSPACLDLTSGYQFSDIRFWLGSNARICQFIHMHVELCEWRLALGMYALCVEL